MKRDQRTEWMSFSVLRVRPENSGRQIRDDREVVIADRERDFMTKSVWWDNDGLKSYWCVG